MADENTWETDNHERARLQFISTWKDHFPPERLESLSMVWANMTFMGCRYPTAVEKLVKDLESKTTFTKLPLTRKDHQKVEFKPANSKKADASTSLITNFVIYEPSSKDDQQNVISILYESSQKSKKSISFEEQPVSQKGHYSFGVHIDKQLIATGQAVNKKDAKRLAAENALEVLKSCQPVVKKRKIDHDAAPTINKTELTKQAYVNANSIPESNVGNQLLRKMGWTGGGVGKQGQGRAEPVLVTGVDGKKGLGQGSNPNDVNKDSIRQVLLDFINGSDMDMKFSTELAKEDRAIVHKISTELGLRHQSYGEGKDRYLLISKQVHNQ